MKKALVMIAVGVTLLMSGCSQHETEKNQQEENRLIVIDRCSNSYRIYVDKETMVMYLRTKQGYGEALCVMVDADGKPLLWKGEQDEQN